MRTTTEDILRNIEALDISALIRLDPIPPVLLELVTLMAVISADADWKTFIETGNHPMLDETRKEGCDG